MALRGGTLTRRQVADLLDLHQDSVTRALPDGLGAAVRTWGGRGKEMAFDRVLVLRWARASKCTTRQVPGEEFVGLIQRRLLTSPLALWLLNRWWDSGTSACFRCWFVLEDYKAVAEHLIATRRGCGKPPSGKQCQPCGAL